MWSMLHFLSLRMAAVVARIDDAHDDLRCKKAALNPTRIAHISSVSKNIFHPPIG
jgi:hypothetical protein